MTVALPPALTEGDGNGRDIYGPHAVKFSPLAKVFFGFLAVVAVASTTFGFSGMINDSEQARSDRLRACQSVIAVRYVSAPQALTFKALAEEKRLDGPKFQAAAKKLQPERYLELTALALVNQTAFLNECDKITKT